MIFNSSTQHPIPFAFWLLTKLVVMLSRNSWFIIKEASYIFSAGQQAWMDMMASSRFVLTKSRRSFFSISRICRVAAYLANSISALYVTPFLCTAFSTFVFKGWSCCDATSGIRSMFWNITGWRQGNTSCFPLWRKFLFGLASRLVFAPLAIPKANYQQWRFHSHRIVLFMFSLLSAFRIVISTNGIQGNA